jgi:hypothetical protein
MGKFFEDSLPRRNGPEIHPHIRPIFHVFTTSLFPIFEKWQQCDLNYIIEILIAIVAINTQEFDQRRFHLCYFMLCSYVLPHLGSA